MPEATSFNALGAGNGFPFCLERVDVDEQDFGEDVYDYWTTLGGYNKAGTGTEVTEEQIGLSHANAMKLFWRFYGLNGSANDDGDVTTNVSPDATTATWVDNGYSQFFDTSNPSSLKEPKYRVCVAEDAWLRLPNSSPTSSAVGYINLFPVVRMYYADEYIGLGIYGTAYFTATDDISRGCWVGISSLYANEFGGDYEPYFGVDYTVLDGMHFVVDGAYTGGSFNAATLTSTASFSGRTMECQIAGLNLYTFTQ